MAQSLLIIACVAAAAWQLWRVPRVWAFLLLFIVLVPKQPLLPVPGNTTPIRVDDLVIAIVLGAWAAARVRVRLKPDTTSEDATSDIASSGVATSVIAPSHIPASSISLFVALYWSAAAVCTLVGIAAPTTAALTGLLHFGRLVEYGLLYYFFYSAIDPGELDRVVEVFRTALAIVCGIWLVQHWTHTVGPLVSSATLYPTFSATYDFGGYLMLATVMLYALWMTGASRSVWTTAALLAGAYLTVNSESRSSLLGLALVVAVDLAVRLRWKAVVVIGAAAAVAPYLVMSKKMLTLVGAARALLTTADTSAIRDAFVSDPSLALRLRNWRLAFEHWLARPWLGDGLGGYLGYIRQYDLPASPDGWYIRLLADTGVAGFVAFALLMSALLWTLVAAWRRETQPLRRAILYGAALAVVAASASAVLLDTFVSYKIMGVFWMMMGIGTRLAAEPAR